MPEVSGAAGGYELMAKPVVKIGKGLGCAVCHVSWAQSGVVFIMRSDMSEAHREAVRIASTYSSYAEYRRACPGNTKFVEVLN